MAYSITLNKPMAIMTKQNSDITGMTKAQIVKELDKGAACFERGEYLPVDVFFKKFEREHDICAIRS